MDEIKKIKKMADTIEFMGQVRYVSFKLNMVVAPRIYSFRNLTVYEYEQLEIAKRDCDSLEDFNFEFYEARLEHEQWCYDIMSDIDMDYLKSNYNQADFQWVLDCAKKKPSYWVEVLKSRPKGLESSKLINRMDWIKAIKGTSLTIDDLKEYGQAVVSLAYRGSAYWNY